MIDVTAWKQAKNDDKSVVCRLQVAYRDARKVKTVVSVLDGWRECGSGFSPANKQSILIFTRKFSNDEMWKQFLKSFPYRIVEKTPTNKTRIYNARKVVK